MVVDRVGFPSDGHYPFGEVIPPLRDHPDCRLQCLGTTLLLALGEDVMKYVERAYGPLYGPSGGRPSGGTHGGYGGYGRYGGHGGYGGHGDEWEGKMRGFSPDNVLDDRPTKGHHGRRPPAVHVDKVVVFPGGSNGESGQNGRDEGHGGGSSGSKGGSGGGGGGGGAKKDMGTEEGEEEREGERAYQLSPTSPASSPSSGRWNSPPPSPRSATLSASFTPHPPPPDGASNAGAARCRTAPGPGGPEERAEGCAEGHAGVSRRGRRNSVGFAAGAMERPSSTNKIVHKKGHGLASHAGAAPLSLASHLHIRVRPQLSAAELLTASRAGVGWGGKGGGGGKRSMRPSVDPSLSWNATRASMGEEPRLRGLQGGLKPRKPRRQGGGRRLKGGRGRKMAGGGLVSLMSGAGQSCELVGMGGGGRGGGGWG